jgi:Uma2 family endonuclease
MSVSIPVATVPQVVYPDCDGQPMSDNTKQFRWIVTIQGGLDALYANDPNVFVAGDLLWYPVEGDNTIRTAPDTMVVFGRPKGDRGSYQQWRENHIAPQVVFEVLSPGNRRMDIVRKLGFYEHYGVEECYIYDPDDGDLSGWQRVQGQWRAIESMSGFTSPRLGVRFELTNGELELYRPDGRRFATFVELSQQREAEQQRADAERQRADGEQQRADGEQQRADAEQQRAERLAAQLRALGVDPVKE